MSKDCFFFITKNSEIRLKGNYYTKKTDFENISNFEKIQGVTIFLFFVLFLF